MIRFRSWKILCFGLKNDPFWVHLESSSKNRLCNFLLNLNLKEKPNPEKKVLQTDRQSWIHRTLQQSMGLNYCKRRIATKKETFPPTEYLQKTFSLGKWLFLNFFWKRLRSLLCKIPSFSCCFYPNLWAALEQ